MNDSIEFPKIGFILFVTQTSPFKLPSASCLILHKIGLPNDIFVTDINMGCSGFIYALKLSESLVNINPKKESESMNHHTHYLKFKSQYRYVQAFWEENELIDRCWVPWIGANLNSYNLEITLLFFFNQLTTQCML